MRHAFSFNDRIRDAVLGGSPFGHPLQQGLVTGLSLEVILILQSSYVHCLAVCFLSSIKILFTLLIFSSTVALWLVWKSLNECWNLLVRFQNICFKIHLTVFLLLQPNDHDHGSKSTVEHMLAVSKDHIQVHLKLLLNHILFWNLSEIII